MVSYIPTRVQELVNLFRFAEKIDCAIPCKNGEQRIIGEKYYNSYWDYSYDVISIEGNEVTIKRDDGRIITHCTPLSSSDWHFIKAEEFSF